MVGDSIQYSRVLGGGVGRVLLVSPDQTAKLGNVDDPQDIMDAVNKRYLEKVISEIPTSGLTLVEGNGIEIDDTDPENPIISVEDGLFMHLTGAIDESADGNKTFTGLTQIDYHIGDRFYSTSEVSPSIGFYNHINNGNAAFNITGTGSAGDTNYLNVTGVLGGSNPILSAVGISTNIGINLTPKGTGSVSITNLTGVGTEMLVISATGVISRQAIPGGGGGGTDVTLAAFGSTPAAEGASINGAGQILTLQPADLTHPGGISLFAQVMGAGNKTFTDDIIMGSTKSLRNATGTQFLSIDAGGFINLQGSANTVIRGGGTTSQITLSASAAIIGAPAVTLNSTSTVAINAATGQTINFGTTGTTGETVGDITFSNLRPVYLKSVGALAPAAASQKGSSILHFESNLFDGSSGVLKTFTVSAVASTSVNNLTNLTTRYDGTTLHSTSQTGDFEILASGAGIILTDTALATRHRVVLTNGILTVSAAL